MRKSKSSIPPFLKGKSIKNKKYSRLDSVNLAKDASEYYKNFRKYLNK